MLHYLLKRTVVCRKRYNIVIIFLIVEKLPTSVYIIVLKQRLQEQYFKVPHDLSSRFAAGLKTYQSADGANISITDSKISVN